jgi:quinol monooxygenase YgiN
MSTSLLAAAVSTLIAAACTGMLALRCAHGPRADLVAWVVSAAALTISLAAQAFGFSHGYGPTTFRIVQVSAQVIAVICILWGASELAGKNTGPRFSARLGLGALGVVGGVILATDLLGSTAFSKAWPATDTYYQLIPVYVLDLIDIVAVIWGLAVIATVAARSGRDPAWRWVFPATLAAVLAAWVTLGLRVSLPVNSAYPALCLLAVVLIWFAGRRASGVPLARLRGGDYPAADWDDERQAYGGYGDDTGYGDRYRPGGGGFGGEDGPDTGYGFYRADTGAMAVDTGEFGPDTGYSLYRADTGEFSVIRPDDSGAFDRLYRDEPAGRRDASGRPAVTDPPAGLVETGDVLPGMAGLIHTGPLPAGADTTQLYGQIAIYTLLEGQAEEFDRLAKDVVDQVKQREPDTLVYVMHGVPSAPMQRILYEVYRDSAAFDEHSHQPYVEHFEEVKQPFVLATNVIELGVRQAKVMPLEEGGPAPARRHRDIWGQDVS